MTMLSNWLELFYLQAVLPEQNDTKPLLYVRFRYVQWNSTTSGNTVYKPPLAAWHKVVWHEVAFK
jgi:hypothetical protein